MVSRFSVSRFSGFTVFGQRSQESVIFEDFSPTCKSQTCRTLRVPERLPPAEVLVATSGMNTCRKKSFYHSLFILTNQAELTYRLAPLKGCSSSSLNSSYPCRNLAKKNNFITPKKILLVTWPVNPRSQLTALAASGATGTSHRDLATQYRVVLTQVWPLIHFMYSFIFYFETHYSFWRGNTKYVWHLGGKCSLPVLSANPCSVVLFWGSPALIQILPPSRFLNCALCGEFFFNKLMEESFEIVVSPGSRLDTLPRSGDRFGRGPEVFHWRHCQREREPGHF